MTPFTISHAHAFSKCKKCGEKTKGPGFKKTGLCRTCREPFKPRNARERNLVQCWVEGCNRRSKEGIVICKLHWEAGLARFREEA